MARVTGESGTNGGNMSRPSGELPPSVAATRGIHRMSFVVLCDEANGQSGIDGCPLEGVWSLVVVVGIHGDAPPVSVDSR